MSRPFHNHQYRLRNYFASAAATEEGELFMRLSAGSFTALVWGKIRNKNSVYWAALVTIAVALIGKSSASAAPLTVGDILVGISPSSQNNSVLAEFTPSGTLVESWQMPATSPLEGVAVGPNLTPYAYLGWTPSEIWTVNPTTNATSTFTYSGLSMDQSVANGQIATYGNYLYATDFDTGTGANNLNGIVRFDLSNSNAGQRYFDPLPETFDYDSDFQKVTVGYNGNLYALQGQGGYQSNGLLISNPNTMSTATPVTLPEEANALAVDSSGNYFLLRDGGIDEFNSSFTLTKSLTLTGYSGFLSNLELSSSGNIVVTSSDGNVMVSNTQLSSFTSFNLSGLVASNDSVDQASATFIEAPQVPEPASLMILTTATSLLLVRRRQRQL
jgi:hypothetical protein